MTWASHGAASALSRCATDVWCSTRVRRSERREPVDTMLLKLLTLPYVRKHVLRTLLTSTGIVLGVTVFVGMHTANHTVLSAFTRTVDRIAGKTELQISSGDVGFNED